MAHPLTMITQRRVRPAAKNEFDKALHALIRASLEFPGQLGVHVLSPADAASCDYAIIRKFADAAAQARFYESSLYRDWQRRVMPMVEGAPDVRLLEGLESWFSLPNAAAPAQWKMAVLTFFASYPTILLLVALLDPFIGREPPWAQTFVVVALLVPLLTWSIMPAITRVFRGWLYPQSPAKA